MVDERYEETTQFHRDLMQRHIYLIFWTLVSITMSKPKMIPNLMKLLELLLDLQIAKKMERSLWCSQSRSIFLYIFHGRDEREMMLQKQMKLAKTLITHVFSMKPVIHDVTYDAPSPHQR